MKLDPAQTLESVARIIGCSYEGPADFTISGINEIHRVQAGDLVFVDHPKYYDKALQSAATTVLINQKVECPEGKALIFSDNPFSDFNRLTRHFAPTKPLQSHRGDEVQIGSNTHIHPSAVIGHKVVIGNDTTIHAGVVIYDRVRIGDRCTIHANSVLGADAFYFKARPEGREKLYSCGEVVIEDDVEIGALCTIDRGVSADTRIGAHTKLDNQVHVGHDSVIGRHCLIAAQVGIAGCVVVEDHVTLWGQAGVPSNITLREGSTLLGQSAVMADTEKNKTYLGSPAQESRKMFRELSMLRKLPELMDELNKRNK